MKQLFLSARRRATVGSFVFVALILQAGLAAWASELLATKDFADVAATVEDNVKQFGAEHVLLVLDIDNTVMSMDDDLGSDHWFEWQNYLLTNEPDSPHLVARTFPGLLEAQGILYNRGHMHPTQPNEPQLISKIQSEGVSTILLTSRGPEFRGSTERELKRCGYDFAKSALEVHDIPTGEYLPYDPKDPQKSGLEPAELAKYKLGTPRPVLYANGCFMTAGQHKGMLLLTLLKHAKNEIKAIVYVDDNVRHVGAVFSAAVARKIEVTSYQYQREDVRVQRFQYGDKTAVDDAWLAMKNSERGVKEVSIAKPQLNNAAPDEDSSSRLRIMHPRKLRRRCCKS
jgi:hypothetical protein